MVYLCIGIGYWIGSYQMVHQKHDHQGYEWCSTIGVPMYWNWELDWVTFICIDKKSWDTTSKVPMNWNWSYQVVRIQNNLRGHESCSHVWQNKNSGSLFPAYIWSISFLTYKSNTQFPIPNHTILYHTTPRGNFLYKLATILSSNGRVKFQN